MRPLICRDHHLICDDIEHHITVQITRKPPHSSIDDLKVIIPLLLGRFCSNSVEKRLSSCCRSQLHPHSNRYSDTGLREELPSVKGHIAVRKYTNQTARLWQWRYIHVAYFAVVCLFGGVQNVKTRVSIKRQMKSQKRCHRRTNLSLRLRGLRLHGRLHRLWCW